MFRARRLRLAALAVAALVASCATFPENALKPNTGPEKDYRYDALAAVTDNASNDPETLVLVAFSGGGVRASALAFGVLEQLRKTEVTIDGKRKRLLDEIDVISSNSGGSYTAAYYGLFRDRMFSDSPEAEYRFENAFLKADFEGQILHAMYNPENLLHLLSPYYNRTDLAAATLGKSVFHDKTFGDLYGNGRPFIILNTHDIVKGGRFQFTQDFFDGLCSDLSRFPVARAVMASSALHGLFGTVRVKNYTRAYCTPPEWIPNALEDLERNPSRFTSAKLIERYYRKECWDGDQSCKLNEGDSYFAFQNDGGAVDNLGLRPLVWGLTSLDPDMSFMRQVNLGIVKRVLLISVNAGGEPDSDLERSQSGPSAVNLIQSAVDSAIEQVSYDSLEFARTVFETRMKSKYPLAQYHRPVIVAFDRIKDRDMRHCFKNVGTRLTLPDGTIDQVSNIGRNLLWQSQAFQDFVKAYDGASETPAAPVCTPP